VGKDLKHSVQIGAGAPLALIAGPCVIESREHVLRMAEILFEMTSSMNVPLIFKASYDKANRTSLSSFRGHGIEEGLEILAEVREKFAIPVVSDVHTEEQVQAAGKILDLLQIPAFLCRQTSLLLAAGATGKPVMVKKGQFMAPEDMQYAVEKVREGGSSQVLLCERGTCFGYRELVVDFRALNIMSQIGVPVVYDATHSVQVMGGGSGVSSGKREFISTLARAAAAVGVNGLFVECHDNPSAALSDGPNMLTPSELERLLRDVKAISELPLQTKDSFQ